MLNQKFRINIDDNEFEHLTQQEAPNLAKSHIHKTKISKMTANWSKRRVSQPDIERCLAEAIEASRNFDSAGRSFVYVLLSDQEAKTPEEFLNNVIYVGMGSHRRAIDHLIYTRAAMKFKGNY